MVLECWTYSTSTWCQPLRMFWNIRLSLDKGGRDRWLMMVQHIQASCVLVSDKLTEIIRMLTTRSIIREVTIPGGPSHVTRHPVSNMRWVNISTCAILWKTQEEWRIHEENVKNSLGKINLHVKMIYGFQWVWAEKLRLASFGAQQTNLNKIWKRATEKIKR